MIPNRVYFCPLIYGQIVFYCRLLSCAIAALPQRTLRHKCLAVIDQHAGFVVILRALGSFGIDERIRGLGLEQFIACALLGRAIELIFDRVSQ